MPYLSYLEKIVGKTPLNSLSAIYFENSKLLKIL